ncbi:MAG: septum site-determining protein MinD [Clostridiales bacterium]|nr:septum site-determining protein MinD [Clostridiales bacterium]
MARKIVVTGGKGGVGKTTVVGGLGTALSRLGYKTLLVDMDFGLNNLDVLLGVENKIVYDLIDVIESKCRPIQAVIEDIFEDNLFVLPSSHCFCSVKFGANELSGILKELESCFDFILIDCPAGIDGGFKRAVGCADEYVLVTTPHLSAIRDADKVITELNKQTNKTPFLVINRARGDLMLSGEMFKVESITKHLSAELIGVIPDDDFVSVQLFSGRKMAGDSLSEISFDMMARNLTSDRRVIFDVTKRYRGLLGGIRKSLKRRL